MAWTTPVGTRRSRCGSSGSPAASGRSSAWSTRASARTRSCRGPTTTCSPGSSCRTPRGGQRRARRGPRRLPRRRAQRGRRAVRRGRAQGEARALVLRPPVSAGLRAAVARAYAELDAAGLGSGATGNVSAVDHAAGVAAITPRGGKPGLSSSEVALVALDGTLARGRRAELRAGRRTWPCSRWCRRGGPRPRAVRRRAVADRRRAADGRRGAGRLLRRRRSR